MDEFHFKQSRRRDRTVQRQKTNLSYNPEEVSGQVGEEDFDEWVDTQQHDNQAR